MGACCSCCADEPRQSGPYSTFQGTGGGHTTGPETERDREARALAAERAAARQQNFESSAVGKAAYKSVKEVKEQRTAGAVGNNGQPDARDWMN